MHTDNLPDLKIRVDFVRKKLTFWTLQWLIVFDNYNNSDTFTNIQDFILDYKFGGIIVTNRYLDSTKLIINQKNCLIKLLGLDEIIQLLC